MRRVALLVAALTAGTALVLTAGGDAQSRGERTFTLYEDATHETTRLVDAVPKSPSPDPGSKRFRLSPGDQLVGVTPVLDKKGGKRIGTLYGTGTVVTGNSFSNARTNGQFVFDLPDGKIVVAGILRDRPNQTFAVIGGTGAYEGARGTQTEKDLGVGGVETFHLLP